MHAVQAAPDGALERLRDRYGRVLEVLVIVLMVALAAEVTLGVVFRTLGRSLAWYDEVASVLLAWMTFYGSALASVRRAHISCPEIVEQAGPALRRALDVAAQLVVIAFFALLGWTGATILPILAGDALVSLPAVPMSVVQSVIPISCALILIAEAMHLIVLLRPPGSGTRPGAAGSAVADGLH